MFLLQLRKTPPWIRWMQDTADLDEMTEYRTDEEEGKRKVIQSEIDICGVVMPCDLYYWDITRKNINFVLPFAVIIDVNGSLDADEGKELTIDISYILKNEQCRNKVRDIIVTHKNKNRKQITN